MPRSYGGARYAMRSTSVRSRRAGQRTLGLAFRHRQSFGRRRIDLDGSVLKRRQLGAETRALLGSLPLQVGERPPRFRGASWRRSSRSPRNHFTAPRFVAVRRVLERQRPDRQGFSSGSGAGGSMPADPTTVRAPRSSCPSVSWSRRVSSPRVKRCRVSTTGRRRRAASRVRPWSGSPARPRTCRGDAARGRQPSRARERRGKACGAAVAPVCLPASGNSYSPRVGSSPTGRADRGHDRQRGDVQYRRRPRRRVGSAKRNCSALTELTAEPALAERMTWDASRKGARSGRVCEHACGA
jgi:hypothetical protein